MSSILESRPQSKMVDMSTQTDLDEPAPIQVPPQLPPRVPARESRTPSPVLADIPETRVIDDTPTISVAEVPVSKVEEPKTEEPRVEQTEAEEKEDKYLNTAPASTARLSKTFDDIDLEDDLEDEEEPIIEEIHQAAAPQTITRARIVQVAKPMPPKLPPRNPFRSRASVQSNTASDEISMDQSSAKDQSPPTTPSLKNDSSASSLDDFEGLEHVSNGLQPHVSQETPKAQNEEKKEYHPSPESPMKSIPGGFI